MTRAPYLVTLLLLADATAGAEPGVRVVVNEANPVSSLSRDELSDRFLKKVSFWADGTLVLPVDQAEDAAVRDTFTREILRKSSSALRAYWHQRIFSGRDIPPLQKDDDAAVLAFVRRNRGAIGYVSAEAPVAGVKVIVVRK
jgi:ABC-type phosphate transport system substrate-binding protein